MAVKVVRLDYPIGSKVKLPNYITLSKQIISLENTDNNLCFWACIALADGSRRDRYITKATELFHKYYKNKLIDDQDGFDYVNELDTYEMFNDKYTINVVSYFEDRYIQYVKK